MNILLEGNNDYNVQVVQQGEANEILYNNMNHHNNNNDFLYHEEYVTTDNYPIHDYNNNNNVNNITNVIRNNMNDIIIRCSHHVLRRLTANSTSTTTSYTTTELLIMWSIYAALSIFIAFGVGITIISLIIVIRQEKRVYEYDEQLKKQQQQNTRRKSSQQSQLKQHVADPTSFRHHHQVTPSIIPPPMPPSNRTLARTETEESIMLAEQELQQIQIRQQSHRHFADESRRIIRRTTSGNSSMDGTTDVNHDNRHLKRYSTKLLNVRNPFDIYLLFLLISNFFFGFFCMITCIVYIVSYTSIESDNPLSIATSAPTPSPSSYDYNNSIYNTSDGNNNSTSSNTSYYSSTTTNSFTMGWCRFQSFYRIFDITSNAWLLTVLMQQLYEVLLGVSSKIRRRMSHHTLTSAIINNNDDNNDNDSINNGENNNSSLPPPTALALRTTTVTSTSPSLMYARESSVNIDLLGNHNDGYGFYPSCSLVCKQIAGVYFWSLFWSLIPLLPSLHWVPVSVVDTNGSNNNNNTLYDTSTHDFIMCLPSGTDVTGTSNSNSGNSDSTTSPNNNMTISTSSDFNEIASNRYVFFYLVYLPGVALIPMLYMSWIIFRISRKKLYEQVDYTTRQLSSHYIQMCISFILVYLPSFILIFILSSSKTTGSFGGSVSNWVFWTGGFLTHLMPFITIYLTLYHKPSIKQIVYQLLLFKHIDLYPTPTTTPILNNNNDNNDNNDLNDIINEMIHNTCNDDNLNRTDNSNELSIEQQQHQRQPSVSKTSYIQRIGNALEDEIRTYSSDDNMNESYFDDYEKRYLEEVIDYTESGDDDDNVNGYLSTHDMIAYNEKFANNTVTHDVTNSITNPSLEDGLFHISSSGSIVSSTRSRLPSLTKNAIIESLSSSLSMIQHHRKPSIEIHYGSSSSVTSSIVINDDDIDCGVSIDENGNYCTATTTTSYCSNHDNEIINNNHDMIDNDHIITTMNRSSSNRSCNSYNSRNSIHSLQQEQQQNQKKLE